MKKEDLHLVLKRISKLPDRTIGKLYVNGSFFCYTLENTVRPCGIKVYGKTAIEAGTYHVKMAYSPHFGKDMPLLLNVPDFVGIRMHGGNVPADTDGCILVAFHTDMKKIWGSASQKLTKLIKNSPTGRAILNII